MGNKSSNETKEKEESQSSQQSESAQKEEKWDDIKVDYSIFDDDGYNSSSISETLGKLTEDIFGKENNTKHLLKECMDLRKAKARYEIDDETKSVTFYPSESAGITASKSPLQTEEFLLSNRYAEIMKFLKCSKIEHMYSDSIKTVKSSSYINPFAAAAEFAFYKHYPLSIKPSDIWILILHATSLHISRNAEKLRDKFVNHDGKKKLIVARPEFVKGAKDNDWDGVVNEFIEQIDENTVNDVVPLFEPDFTSANFMDRLAVRVTTMDILQEYFEYHVFYGCGFPQITLNGTKDDWIKLKQKTKTLLQTKVIGGFGKKWGYALIPILQRFIDAYNGKIDCLFWNSMVRRGAIGGSGMRVMPTVGGKIDGNYCGWLNVFFPYNETRLDSHAIGWGGDKKKEPSKKAKGAKISWNEYCVPYSKKASYVMQGYTQWNTNGMYAENFPLGIGSAPVIYTDLKTGNKYDLKFVSGFLGIEQDKDSLELSCKVGWFVAEK